MRPLLGVSRREIREFLNAIDQPFREDETNAALESHPKSHPPRSVAEAGGGIQPGRRAKRWSGWVSCRRRSHARSIAMLGRRAQRDRHGRPTSRRAQARVPAIDARDSDADGNPATRLEACRLARGEHVGAAMASPGRL